MYFCFFVNQSMYFKKKVCRNVQHYLLFTFKLNIYQYSGTTVHNERDKWLSQESIPDKWLAKNPNPLAVWLAKKPMAVWLAKKTTLAVWLAKKTIGCVAELTKVEHKNNNNHTCCGVSPGSGTSCGCFEGPGFSYRCFVQHLFHHVELFLFLFQCSTQLLLYLPLLLFLNSKQKSWQKIYTKKTTHYNQQKRGHIFYLPPLFFLNSKKELVRWLDDWVVECSHGQRKALR